VPVAAHRLRECRRAMVNAPGQAVCRGWDSASTVLARVFKLARVVDVTEGCESVLLKRAMTRRGTGRRAVCRGHGWDPARTDARSLGQNALVY
jgi:hypothetical protein